MDIVTFARRLTSGYGLVQMPFADFAPWLALIPAPPGQVWSFTRPVNAADALSRLAPLSHPPRRYLILPLATDWCAVVDNKRDGPDFADLQLHLEPHCHAPTIRVIDHQGTTTIANGYRERMRWEAHIIEIRGPSTCRSIACANDGGRWIFETSGDPLPIESNFPYDARRKSDRFGTEQVAAILAYLGARPLSGADVLSADRFLMLESRQRNPADQQRLQRWDCSPDEADDPAFGYWMRASAWIDHLETHATSAVSDLTRAVALNPDYAEHARPHLERARRILGSTAYNEEVDRAISLLKPDR